VPIKAFSGSISSLPLPEVVLSDDILDGDILVYNKSLKVFENKLAADKATGKLFVTGALSTGGNSVVDSVANKDIKLKGLTAGNMITIDSSVDGNSLVIGVNSAIANSNAGFTGELKTSDIIVVPDAVTVAYKFVKVNNGQELELNGNFTIVYRNGRRLSPDEYSFGADNRATFFNILEGDELHIDTITGETDNKLVHSKRVTAQTSVNAYEFLDQQNNLVTINNHFLEVFVNRIKVHQRDYAVQENKVIFASGSIVDQDELEIITLGDI
jgi:hypothetical protein